MTVGYVSISSKVAENQLSDEDADVIGSYRFECSENISDGELATALLNSFHAQVPVDALEDVEVRAYNENEEEIFENGSATKIEMVLKEFSPLHTFDK